MMFGRNRSVLSFLQTSKGKLQPAEVILKIDSPNFRPRTQSKKLKIPPKHDSEVCTFLLTPLKVGELVANLELLVGDQVIVSRAIRTKAEPEGSPVSSAKVVVCLPLVLLVGGDTAWRGSTLSSPSLLNQGAGLTHLGIPEEMSLPTPLPPPVPTSIARSSARPTSKPTSLTGRIGAALGVLVFIAISAFLYAHRQYGPKVVVKPPDKTQQDVKQNDDEKLREEHTKNVEGGAFIE